MQGSKEQAHAYQISFRFELQRELVDSGTLRLAPFRNSEQFLLAKLGLGTARSLKIKPDALPARRWGNSSD
jgi:hypothetical protein